MAEHNVTKEKVAIKVIEKSLIQSEETMKLVKKEIFTITRIDHKYLLKVKDYFQTATAYYIVSEYLPNGNLMNLINKGVPN